MNRDPRFALARSWKRSKRCSTSSTPWPPRIPISSPTSSKARPISSNSSRPSAPRSSTTLADGAKAALDKLQARKRAAEHRIELKRRLLALTLQQIGLKTLRTPTATLTLAEASLKAIAVAREDIPARWWKPQSPKLDQDGLTKQTPRPSTRCPSATARRPHRPFLRAPGRPSGTDQLARAQSACAAEFWAHAPADALGVKQELEKALAQNGKPTT
jgi:hypothetical protein